MHFELTAAAVAVLLSVVSVLRGRERSRYKSLGEVYKMEKTLIYPCLCLSFSMLALAIFLSVQAAYYGGSHGGDAGVPAFVGVAASCCALIWSVYEVRLDATSIKFGLVARLALQYSEIKEIRDIRNQGSPRAVLISGDGKGFNIWSNVLGYHDLIDKLKARCPSASYHLVEGRSSRL
jgi:hypothetical protein